jgi:hypothetical protein
MFVFVGCAGRGGEPPDDGGGTDPMEQTTGEVVDSGETDPDDSDGTDDAGETGDPPSAANGLPCDVAEILARNCTSCHADPPKFGAPMSLETFDDLHLPTVTDVTRSVYEVVADRIEDDALPMPPTGQLTAEDRNVLHAWIDAGAPRSDDECEDADDPDEPDVGPDALPCEPTQFFTAHAAGKDDEGFAVPDVDNLYQCFTFRSDLAPGSQATAWAPIVDDERVLHHWILYRTAEPQEDGGVMPCNMPGDATFVAGWAPGSTNYVMPAGVGLEFGGPDDYFILQIHYNNIAGYGDAVDMSGVALCEAEEPRPIEAGIFTLGTLGINIPPETSGHVAEGTCPSWITSYLPEDVHILASFPHMHELGTQISTEILRGGENGTAETLVNVDPFAFQNQKYYPHEPEVLLHPGDALRTQCTYDNPSDHRVWFGEGTDDEMCFNFVMVYPLDIVGENRQCGLI